MAVLLLVCVVLLPRSKKNSQFLPFGNIEDSIRPLSFRIVPLFTFVLCIQALWFGFSGVQVASTLFLGVAKALSWYFTTRMVRKALHLQNKRRNLADFRLIIHIGPLCSLVHYPYNRHV